MRVLLIEDDDLLGEGLASGMRSDGHTVDWTTDGQRADTAIRTATYDCLILDIGLPGRDGLSWLAQWRSQGHQFAVIMLTARNAIDSRISGLDSGADDYLIKPVTTRELCARIRAVTRRAGGRPSSLWAHGLLTYDAAARAVQWRSQPVELTSRELALLEILIDNPTRVISKSQLIERMYSWGESVEENALEVFVHHLRRKTSASVVRTVRGIGYTLGAADE